MAVTYNGTQLGGTDDVPTPFVSRSMEPVDAGAKRLGFVENIELNGHFQISNLDYVPLLNIFKVSPAILLIEGASRKVFVTSVSISETAFELQGNTPGVTLIPYNVKFKSYENLPDKIKNPSLEYSYSEDENRILTLTIKASADGLTSVEDARSFVDALIADSSFNPTTTEDKAHSIILKIAAVGNGATPPRFAHPGSAKWAPVSKKKTIDRTKFSYSVEKVLKRNPAGIAQTHGNFYFFDTVNVSQSLSSYSQDFKTYDFDVNLKILSKDANTTYTWGDVENEIGGGGNYIKKIVDHYLNSTVNGITPGVSSKENIEGISITKNEAANEMTIKFSLVDCPAEDFKGYFDYTLSTDYNLADENKIVSIDGQFVSRGDMANRRKSVNQWLNAKHTALGFGQALPQGQNSAPNYYDFVKTLTTQPLMTPVPVPMVLPSEISIDHNPEKAEFKLSATLDDKMQTLTKTEHKYGEMSFNVVGNLKIPIFKFVHSSNVEGHHIIQDYQTSCLEKINITVNGTPGDSEEASYDALMTIGKDTIDKIYKGTHTTISFVNAAPESSSVNINKNNNSFDMSFSAMYHGRDLGLETQFLKNQGGKQQNAASHALRFGR